MLKKVLKLFSQGKAILIIVIGSISWSLTMVKSGLVYPFGLGFWGPNGHDGIWHIALANSLAKGGFNIPTFAGERIKNYHIGFDLVLGFLSKLTSFSTATLYFQIIPPIIAVAIGLVVYKLMITWTGSKVATLWSLFFVYFGGSLAWILGKGESAFWSQQAISTLINPPFAVSLLILSGALLLLLKKKYFWATLLFGILIEIKAYAGVLALGSLVVISLWRILKERKFDYLLVFFFSSIISLILFLPLNNGSSNLFIFQPFWFLETMMGLSDRLGWDKFYSAMTNYRSGLSWKFAPAYFLAFLIFAVGNLGTRMLKDAWIFRKLRNISSVDYISLFSFSMIGAGILIPTLFLQKGTPWNTIQFFYYSVFFSSILAGVGMAHILKNKSKTFITLFSTIIVLLTLPTTAITLKDVYLPGRPPAMISNEEIEALDFLAKQPDGIVLTYPFDSAKAREAINNPPRPLYFYESTAYVSAYGHKDIYLEDEVNLDITGYDWRKRRAKVSDFINELDINKAKVFLKENDIKYLYLVKGTSPLVGEYLRLGGSQLSISQIFSNAAVKIYEVN